MISEDKKHQKHSKLSKPTLGEFGRNEIAIFGTPCNEIKQLVAKLIETITPQFSVAYVDADHASESSEDLFISEGANMSYTNKISYQQVNLKGDLNSYESKYFFNEQDLIIVNGNHFVANEQIVVIDSRKSLEKKIDRLSNTKLFLTINNEKIIPDYLKNHLADWQNIPMLDIGDVMGISKFLIDKITSSIPPMKALVLAGGKSQRMQTDKGKLKYHTVEQRQHVYELTTNMGIDTYMSCRSEQVEELTSFKVIEDSFLDLGPLGAILSAFRHDPNTAWLVVACDLPFVDQLSIQQLIDSRQIVNSATAFKSPKNNFPEPLIAIWEPKIYAKALQLLGLGYSCARKVLINSNTHIIEAKNTNALSNVNHPHEYKDALAKLRG